MVPAGALVTEAASSRPPTWRGCAETGVDAFLVGEAFMRQARSGAGPAALFYSA